MNNEIDTPNRKRDAIAVQRLHGKIKIPGIGVELWAGQTRIVGGYKRLVWGDHGPYFEFDCIGNYHKEKFKRLNAPKAGRYYDLYEAPNGVLVYHQRRSVRHLPNPPHTGEYWADNNRHEGYADYKVGYWYVSALDTRVGLKPMPEVQQPNLW